MKKKININNVKLIIFDLDDTLINTYASTYFLVKKSGKQAFDKIISKKEFDYYYGVPGFDENMKKIFNVDNVKEFLSYFQENLNSLEYKLLINANNLKLLRNKNIKLGIISNSLRKKNKKKLDTNGLKNYFDFIYSFEDLNMPKPDISIINKIHIEMNIKRSEILYVGDSQIDKEFADSAKITFIPVNTGIHKWSDSNSFKTANDFLNFIL